MVNEISQHYKDHPSIQKFDVFLKHTEPFSFNYVTPDEINKSLKKVKLNKSTGDEKVPPKMLPPIVTNSSISKIAFPILSKMAAAISIFKSYDKCDKKNNRLVIVY